MEKPMNSVRWNLAVSSDTDQALRLFLASQGGGRKGDLSRFVEEAVRAYILELSAGEAKSANTNVSETELETIVAEGIRWARDRR
jgi:ribbon-helix-helix protein